MVVRAAGGLEADGLFKSVAGKLVAKVCEGRMVDGVGELAFKWRWTNELRRTRRAFGVTGKSAHSPFRVRAMRAPWRFGLVILVVAAGLTLGVAGGPVASSGAASWPHLVSSAAPNPAGAGYWDVYQDGSVTSNGGVSLFGNMAGQSLTAPIIGITPTSDGHGYWLLGSDGGIFSFGDAKFYGSTGNLHLNAPIVGMAGTPGGGGYWLVGADGGIFAFGNATFHGSMGGSPLNKPIVGMASTPDGAGYWLVAADGGIFSFGDAGFAGSTGSIHLNAPMVGIASTASGHGYWLVASDGGIFAFGDAKFLGSDPGRGITAPAVGMVSTQAGGYTVVLSNGQVSIFGSTLTLSPQSLPGAVQGQQYSTQLQSSGGSGPNTWRVAYGALPTGVSLGPGGLISGTLYSTGTFTFAATVTDSSGANVSAVFTLAVAAAPSVLEAGQTLGVGQSLWSGSDGYEAVMQGDGNFVVYAPNRTAIFDTQTGAAGSTISMQGDGNLVIYSTSGAVEWATGTGGNYGQEAAMQGDGNFVVYGISTRPLWASMGGVTGLRTMTLYAGTSLSAGQALWSPGRAYQFVMQGDGNLVEYKGGTAIWDSQSQGVGHLVMQTDGNLVIYNATSGVMWQSGSGGHAASADYSVTVQDDGNVVVYGPSGALWSSHGGLITSGGSTTTAAESEAMAWAKSMLGSPLGTSGQTYWYGCLAFAFDAYGKGASMNLRPWVSISIGTNTYPSEVWGHFTHGTTGAGSDPPPGALVFWDSTGGTVDSHVAVSIGGGELVSTNVDQTSVAGWNGIHLESMSQFAENSWNIYQGWWLPDA